MPLPNFDDRTIVVIVDIDVRSEEFADFDGPDETDLGDGLILVNVEDAGLLVNLKAIQERCPSATDDANVSY